MQRRSGLGLEPGVAALARNYARQRWYTRAVPNQVEQAPHGKRLTREAGRTKIPMKSRILDFGCECVIMPVLVMFDSLQKE